MGGTVRDAVLRRPITDVDVATTADPEGTARAVASALGGPVFRLSETFGAWRVLDRRRSFVCDVSPLQGGSIEADLGRRDFTVNAMAVPAGGDQLLDPHGGRADAEAGVLRVVAEDAYRADPLRPLRLARLATELPLMPEPETERLTRAAAGRVTEASPERVFGELRRILISDGVVEGLELCDRLGITAAVLPEVEALRSVEQSHFHHLDVHGHTLEVVGRTVEVQGALGSLFGELAPALRRVLEEPLAEEMTRGQALRVAALLHDVGKPATRGVRPDGRVTFIGHDRVGERMVRAICRRLRTSERLAAFVAGVTRHHLALGFMVHERPLGRRALYRYLSACDPIAVEVTVFSCADRLATRGRSAEAAIEAHLEVAAEVLPEALAWRTEGAPRAPVRGDELARELGIEPGPELGRMLRELEEASFAGEVRTRAEAVDYARRSLEAAASRPGD